MINRVHINGVIGQSTFAGEDQAYVTFLDVVRQVESRKDAKEVHVFINSPGGLVEEGDAIYDYLKGLEVPVTTIALSECCSIATKIFLAGEKRLVSPDCFFMIHNPFGGTVGDADALVEYADELRKTQDRMAAEYSAITGTSKSAISELMRTETALKPEEAVDLGFGTGLYQPEQATKAVAYFKKPAAQQKPAKKSKKMSDKKKQKKSFLAKLQAILATHFEGLVLTAAAGPEGAESLELNFNELDEGASPAINDTATVDGKPAEGEYTMPDETKYKFEAGKLVEITEPAGEMDTEQMEAALAEAEKERDDAQAEVVALKKKYKALKKEVMQLQALSSEFVAAGEKKKKERKEDHGAGGEEKRSLLRAEA